METDPRWLDAWFTFATMDSAKEYIKMNLSSPITKKDINRLKRDGWRVGFKVCDGFQSFFNQTSFMMNYALNDITFRKEGWGPMGLFKNIKDGLYLGSFNNKGRLIKCLYKPTASKKREFWFIDYSGVKYSSPASDDHLLADAVLPLEVIKVYNKRKREWKDV